MGSDSLQVYVGLGGFLLVQELIIEFGSCWIVPHNYTKLFEVHGDESGAMGGVKALVDDFLNDENASAFFGFDPSLFCCIEKRIRGRNSLL